MRCITTEIYLGVRIFCVVCNVWCLLSVRGILSPAGVRCPLRDLVCVCPLRDLVFVCPFRVFYLKYVPFAGLCKWIMKSNVGPTGRFPKLYEVMRCSAAFYCVVLTQSRPSPGFTSCLQRFPVVGPVSAAGPPT